MSTPIEDLKMSEFPPAGPIDFITDYVPIVRLVGGVAQNFLAPASSLNVDSGGMSGGGGAVSSVFGRVGIVVAAVGDYNWNQISGPALPPVSGQNVTNLNAAAITIGTLPVGRLPALTGDVSLPAGTSVTAIGAGKVTDAMLAGGITADKLAGFAAGNALITSGAATAPVWGKINLTQHVTGVLPPANGGVGAGALTLNAVLIGNGPNPILTVGPGAARTILAANGAAPFFTTTPTVEGLTVTDGANTAQVLPTYLRFNANVGIERSAAGVLKVTDAGDANQRGWLFARRLDLSNDPAYAPGSGNPANYLQNLRTVQLVTGDPNAADKYQNIVAWTNITGLTAHHSSSQDFYGLDAQIGVVDAANAFNLFTIYGTHAVAFLKGAGNIDDGLIGTMGRASAYGSGTIVKHRGLQGWPVSFAGATGTSVTVQGVYGLISNDAAGYTMTTAVAGDFLLNSNSGTIGNAYVIRARAETVGAGTITGNRYGVYIADQAIGTVAGVVYNFYSAGARLNVIEGKLGVGTITPAAQLDVFNSAGAQLRLTYSTAAPAHYSDFTVGAGGVLTIAPTGSINFSTVGKQIDPLLGNDENLGQLTKKYKSLHAAELWVETLVAQDTIATIGGRILVGPTTTLTADLTAAATVITVKHNQINSVAPGDVLVMQAAGKIEFMLVTAGPTGAGPYSYTVTRNLDGSGANTWNAGDAVFNTGRAGSGFIDLYSISSINPTPATPQLGPTIVGNVRNSATFNDWSEHWAIGNLSGLYGYGATTYGVGLGKYAAGTPHITIDATSGFQVYSGLTNVVARWANDGSITIGQVSATIPRILLDATSGIRFGTTVAVTAQWHPTGFITVGEIGAGLSNVQITSGQLNLRNNTTTYIRLNTDGSGFLANSAISWTAAGFLSVTNNASIAGWTISTASIAAPITGGSVVIASNADPVFTGSTPNCWFGKSTSGYYGFSTKGTTAALVQIVAGVGAVGVNGRPYFVMSDNNSRYRIIIGELNYTGWGLGGTPLDGATDSMGMKIYDSAGGLIVRFCDNVANGGNMISGWTIAPSLISSTGVELRSGAAAGLAFGASPSTITASAGTGIFLDRTGLYGLNAAGTPAGVQVKLDAATGALTAGAGAVTLNAKGIRIQEGNAAEGNYIKWLSGTSDFFTFCGFQLGSPTPARECQGQIVARALASETSGSGVIWLEAQNAAGPGSFIRIASYSAGHATIPNKGTIQIQPWNSGMTYIGWGGSTGFTPSVALKVADGPILLVPMDTTARNALTPTNGMLIYNSTTGKFEGYAAGAWVPLN